jgi:pimeloyl-ACP methyl ester carboxylesterase
MRHASLENMPAELKEAYLKVAPHPEHLQRMHDRCVERMLSFEDWKPEDLRSIQAPVLILNGDSDVIRPEHAVEMFRLLPHAQLAILPGTDHMQMVARWPVEVIEGFLQAPDPQTP